ncbi:autoinducer binding domain-containing protein [Rhizobium helianthi]|uniref:Autoinducer binding domain-containing protein n=1 Tax=Rhizobium helianthi TaxID=1132695 RepID=A0ABW4M485_9HYPH
MNIHSIIQFLALAHEVESEAELVGELESLLARYGFMNYGLWFHHKVFADWSDTMLIGQWPNGWRRHYADRKYATIDPLRRMLAVTQRPFRWRDAIAAYSEDPYRKRALRLLRDAARNGLHDGYVFPIYGRTGLLGILNLSGQAVDLSAAEICLFDTVARKVLWRLLELRGTASDLEKTLAVEAELTQRQMEVLRLLSDGLTSNEIAKALQISNHTVDWYINVIQEKFNARNRQHVIALAFRSGLVT